MDYLVDDQEVDAKWSIKSRGWMIPTEAVGELCLCMTADDDRSTFSVGIVRADEANLRTSTNKDQKRRFNDDGIAAMAWLVRSGNLPENLLLHQETRSAILDYGLSGQQRISQLFRLVHNKVVRREVVLTVAQQQDPPKRVRDARKALQQEGIIVLGHQGSHPGIANGLNVEVPRKGSWIATRVVRAKPHDAGSVLIANARWRRATPGDPVCAGPITTSRPDSRSGCYTADRLAGHGASPGSDRRCVDANEVPEPMIVSPPTRGLACRSVHL